MSPTGSEGAGDGASFESSAHEGLAFQAMRSIGARYVLFLIAAVISIVVSRELAAIGRGPYAWIVAFVTTVVGVGHLSIETSLYLSWSDRHGGRDRLVGAAVALAVVVGGVAAVAGYVVFSRSQPPLLEATSGWLVPLALASIPGSLAVLYLNSVLVNEGRIREMNRAALVAASLQLVAALALAFLGRLTVSAAVVMWAAATVAPLVLLVPAVGRSTGFRFPTRESVAHLVARGLKFHAGSVALALIMRVDVLLLGSRVEASQVGIYSLAVSLAELVLLATAASSQVAVQVQIVGDPQEHAGISAAFSRANGVLGVAIASILILVGPAAIPRVFGETFAGTTAPLAALVPGIVALSMMRPLGVFVTRLDRPLIVNSALTAGLVGNIVLNLLLIPHWGIVGAAVASSIVYVAMFFWASVWFLRATESTWAVLRPRSEDISRGWHVVSRFWARQ